MNLLAIDTSTERASIALSFNGVHVTDEQGAQKTHAQFLLPMVDNLLTAANTSLAQLDGVVFGCGPGSFTGLRIACSIAKGLAYSHDLKLIPISTLAAIAWSVRKELNKPDVPVLAIIDARMQELYWGLCTNKDYEFTEQVSKAQDITLATTEQVVIAGVGVDLYWEQLPDAIKEQISFKNSTFPQALAMIEMVSHLHIPAVSIAQAQPIYIRNQVTQGAARG